MSKQRKAFEKALLDYLAVDAPEALRTLTSHWVSVTLEMIRRQGEDPEKEITITGGRRKVTIHTEAAGKEAQG